MASALFPQAPNNGHVSIATANTNLDGTTGTYSATIITPGANGTIVNSIYVKAKVTTTAGMVRFFSSDGTTTNLILELSVTAVTPSATVQSFSKMLTDTDFGNLVLKSGHTLKCSTEKAETFGVTLYGRDL